MIAITEQIMDMNSRHPKALYFRGKCQYLVEEFENSIATLTKLCQIEPENNDFKAELEHAKRLKAAELKKQKKVYSKMFQ